MSKDASVIKLLHRKTLNKLCKESNIPFEIDEDMALDMNEEDMFIALWDVYMFKKEEAHNTQLHKMLVDKMNLFVSDFL